MMRNGGHLVARPECSGELSTFFEISSARVICRNQSISNVAGRQCTVPVVWLRQILKYNRLNDLLDQNSRVQEGGMAMDYSLCNNITGCTPWWIIRVSGYPVVRKNVIRPRRLPMTRPYD